MNEAAHEIEGNVAIPGSGHASKLGHAGIVRIDVAVVFHFDVLKPVLPREEGSDGYHGANTKKQMSLGLEDF
ncbi:hypothetical protein [Paraburkholderia sediminicola]|uniref:hypothetical protein n=1 Tax=Paraburkholderia sediminicola TaxID=458836 RepID=UPI0038B9E36E